jgi:carboxymethylenebutenolidase
MNNMQPSAEYDAKSVPVHTPPKGRGPGLLLIAAALSEGLANRARLLAEEGYVVAATDAKDRASLEADLDRLAHHPARLGKLGVIAWDEACGAAMNLAGDGRLQALVLYDGSVDAERLAALPSPAVLHIATEEDPQRAAAAAAVVEAIPYSPDRLLTYSYRDARPGFDDEASPNYNGPVSGLAYSRSLGLLRRELGPHYNLNDLWERHTDCEFVLKDPHENMKTMVAEPYVNHIPTMTGGVGHDLLKRFYTYHFIGKTPGDRFTIPISRTVGHDRIIEEKIFCFTHDIEIDWMLPGIKPTGRYVEIPLVAIISFRGDKLYNEHIYWDQASVLAQIGLLDPSGLPVAGAEQVRKLLDKTLPSNTMMPNWATSEGKPI